SEKRENDRRLVEFVRKGGPSAGRRLLDDGDYLLLGDPGPPDCDRRRAKALPDCVSYLEQLANGPEEVRTLWLPLVQLRRAPRRHGCQPVQGLRPRPAVH